MKSVIFFTLLAGYGLTTQAASPEIFNASVNAIVTRCMQNYPCAPADGGQLQTDVAIPLANCQAEPDGNTLCSGEWTTQLVADGYRYDVLLLAMKDVNNGIYRLNYFIGNLRASHFPVGVAAPSGAKLVDGSALVGMPVRGNRVTWIPFISVGGSMAMARSQVAHQDFNALAAAARVK